LIITPQIIFQYALTQLEPITISMIAPLMPIMVFLIGFFTVKLHPTFLTIIGVSYICVISMLGTLMRRAYNKV
jgi:drug/metabolite transporter (DMT)-like permease